MPESESGVEMLEELPRWMPTDDGEENYNLVHSIGESIDRLKDDISEAGDASNVQSASSIDQLRKLAALVEVPPETDESLERYRSRVIADFQAITTECSPSEVIDNTATLLGVNPSNITYERSDEPGVVNLKIPLRALNDLAISGSDFSSVVNSYSKAGGRIDIRVPGTLEYITPEEYTNDNYDASQGYDTLDASGNPEGEGGTYASLIE